MTRCCRSGGTCTEQVAKCSGWKFGAKVRQTAAVSVINYDRGCSGFPKICLKKIMRMCLWQKQSNTSEWLQR